MREIKIDDFASFMELKMYFDSLADNGFNACFFGEIAEDNFFAKMFQKHFEAGNIKVFEYDYLLPSNVYNLTCSDELLERSKLMLLHKFKGQGTYIEHVRKMVLLFANRSFCEYELHDGNVLIDRKSGSAIVAGSFTLSKMQNILQLDFIKQIYAFPYHNCDGFDGLFHCQKYVKIHVAEEMKYELRIEEAKERDMIIQKIDEIGKGILGDKT